MAEKQEHSSARNFHSCSFKLVCPVSLVSLLICTAALVRVEIINQRVHNVEDLVADAWQNQNMIEDTTDATSFERPERVESGEEFDHKITKEGRDETEVHVGRIRRFSSEAGTKPDELTMQSVRSEINKTLNSLRSRSFCSPKEQICVQGPPGLQGPKGSRGRRGPRGVSGRKGSSGSRGKQGPHGKQGITGPPGLKGEQGIMGPPGQKGEQGIVGPPSSKGKQGIMGPPGLKGEQGIMGPPGLKGEQGIMGPPGQKGNQGYMGPTGPKGNQGIMGPPGQKGNQGFIGPAGPKGKQGYMGAFGPKGKQGIMGPVGRKGERGIMGPPGPQGKQGIMGPKGKQGITGFTGPRGIPGAKGEPGGSFSPPTMVIFPMKQTITKKHNAVFQCSVSGNPKPTVTWLGKSSAPLRSRDGRLDLRHLTFDDAGEYTCIGRNFLGITSRTAILIVEGLKYSSIVGNNQIFLTWLDKWLKPLIRQSSSYWNRCYRATVNGWSSYTFHSNCDGKGPSVTIIRVGKYIFGGFTSLSWSSGCSWHYDSAAFLFSLVNKPGWQPVKLDQTGKYSYRRRHSIYRCYDRGPAFGGGHDIYIANNAASSTSSLTNLGFTYSSPAGNSLGSSFSQSFLAGTYSFRPDEVEVFYETT